MESTSATSLNNATIAQRLGVDPSFVSRIKNGKRPPTLEYLFMCWGESTTINDKPLDEWRQVVRDARVEQEISQVQLAKMVEYAKYGGASIYRIESGATKRVAADKFIALLSALNVTMKDQDNEHVPVYYKYPVITRTAPDRPVHAGRDAGDVVAEPSPSSAGDPGQATPRVCTGTRTVNDISVREPTNDGAEGVEAQCTSEGSTN